MLVGAVALPLVRRRLRARPSVILGGAALAPLAAAVLWRRSTARTAIVCALQMYAYVAAYKMPHDNPRALEERVHLDYPIACDRLLGRGELPTVRLQRALHPAERFSALEKLLVWTHWVWFISPQASLAYIYARDRRRFARAAVMTYAVFDVGAVAYWLAPTAPPWYVAERGRSSGEPLRVRRLMVEYGEDFWGERWAPLYGILGGNPLAAMPSLHFATSTMAAILLAESDPLAGAVGGAYATLLGFALVHLGEHYVVDLLGGLALTLAIRRAERRARGPLRAAAAAVERLSRALNERTDRTLHAPPSACEDGALSAAQAATSRASLRI